MFKKNLAALFVLFSAVFIFSSAVNAQETETATRSNLTGIALPAGANRVLPGSVPAEINDTFDKIIAAGNGKVQKGGTEVLVWAGTDYKKANAVGIVSRLTSTLQTAGWKYSVEGNEGGLTVFSAFKEGAARRTIVGFHGATDDALIFSWMELLSAGGSTNNQSQDGLQSENVQNTTVGNTGGGSLVGTWTNGTMGMMGEKNQNGTVTARRGTSFKYVFNPNGTFEFTGYGESTMFGCTTSLFQDKRGRYSISGGQLTLTLTKNFWRKQNACAPASNSEQNYKFDPETYEFRTKQDEYGKTLVCLSNANGESCYRRED
jgi:hypothetical protein